MAKNSIGTNNLPSWLRTSSSLRLIKANQEQKSKTWVGNMDGIKASFHLVDDALSTSSRPSHVVATVDVQCRNRDKGDLHVVLRDSKTSAQVCTMVRTRRSAALWSSSDSGEEIPIVLPVSHHRKHHSVPHVDNASTRKSLSTLAIIRPSTWGNLVTVEMVSNNNKNTAALNTSIQLSVPNWQPSSTWTCIAVLCCIPTFGMACYYGLDKAAKEPTRAHLMRMVTHADGNDPIEHSENLSDYKSTNGGASVLNLQELPSDSAERLAYVMLVVFWEADLLTRFPSSDDTGGAGVA